MPEIAWTDPGVQAALISAVGTLLASLVAALAAALVGKQIAGRKRLKEKLSVAYQDIDFLLDVESEHCALHMKNGSESNKIRVRSAVREKGYQWSGKNTPARR